MYGGFYLPFLHGGREEEEEGTEAFEMSLAPFPPCSLFCTEHPPRSDLETLPRCTSQPLCNFFLFHDILGFCCLPSQTFFIKKTPPSKSALI